MKSFPLRFCVRAADEAAALAHLQARGYSPTSVEEGDDGTVALIFRPLPDNELRKLVEALPIHLSGKIGLVTGSRFPCSGDDKR